jgi:hypothetical protein
MVPERFAFQIQFLFIRLKDNFLLIKGQFRESIGDCRLIIYCNYDVRLFARCPLVRRSNLDASPYTDFQTT